MPTSKRQTRQRGRALPVLGWMIAGLPILLAVGLGFGILGGMLGAYLHFSADLPDIPDLRAYRPKTVSTFYAEDGTVIGVFYREKRFPVSIDPLPPHVVYAFLAAEDARFFSHGGVDVYGVIRAGVKNLKAGTFSQGGSTITQQVTRNFILSREKKITRKIKEAILSFRLEKTLSKKEILEVYLNEICLGKGAYGVEAAARTYFGKPAAALTVAEAAALAGLVSNPSHYSPFRSLDRCLKRREFVLDSMLRNGFITDEQHREASEEKPKLRENLPTPYERVPYFTEAVRQYIVERYGEDRLYNEGLQVWTTCDVPLQDKASEALLKGVAGWEKRQQRPRGLLRRLSKAEAQEFLSGPRKDQHRLGDLTTALVVDNHTPKKRGGKNTNPASQDCVLALPGDVRFRMELSSAVRYRPNDLLEFRVTGTDENSLTLEHQRLPAAQGAVVCIENQSGYVRALVGGVDFERSRFNRAVQAFRQPGSAFKPFVYAAALEWGNYGPRTLIVDEPIAVAMDRREGEWIPANSDGRFLGPVTLRDALAHSRNVVAVKLLMDIGVGPAIHMARNMGIRSRLAEHLSLSLGTSEVTPLELTAAYTVFPNQGVRIDPVLVKKVVDRFGKVLEDNTQPPLEVSATMAPSSYATPFAAQALHDQERHAGPETMDRSEGEPDLPTTSPLDRLLSGSDRMRPAVSRQSSRRVLTPASAYLMVSMLRQACVSGTAAAAGRLKRGDVAGKTGTTDDCTDAWFVGFNPKYTTGVWVGHDARLSLGRDEFGGTAALPVWMEFMKHAVGREPSQGYQPPPGIVFLDEGAVPGKGKREALLEAQPDFEATGELKPVSPVDNYLALAAGTANPFEGQFMPLNAGYGGFPGAIRVLSPSGQQLGFAHYEPDKKGRPTLRTEYPLGIDDTAPGQGLRQQIPGFRWPQQADTPGQRGRFSGLFGPNGWNQ
ncbi:MAG: PBP1A family penicillin-binding protein [Desulfomonile tiedjei]|nr:PBP1A family penicillin-binding protein [Desulfomonile tiedjei]